MVPEYPVKTYVGLREPLTCVKKRYGVFAASNVYLQ
jgi:hypothetical protein